MEVVSVVRVVGAYVGADVLVSEVGSALRIMLVL